MAAYLYFRSDDLFRSLLPFRDLAVQRLTSSTSTPNMSATISTADGSSRRFPSFVVLLPDRLDLSAHRRGPMGPGIHPRQTGAALASLALPLRNVEKLGEVRLLLPQRLDVAALGGLRSPGRGSSATPSATRSARL